VKLRELADRLQCRLEGDGEIEVLRVAGLETAGPGDLTFFANSRYLPALRRTRAAAVILGEHDESAPCAMLRSVHPYLSFAEALDALVPEQSRAPSIHATSAIAPDATLGTDVSVGAFAVIGEGARIGDRVVLHPHVVIGRGAHVGDDCVLHAHVSVRERCHIGKRVVIQDGAVIGSDGFGFARTPEGLHHKIPQAGDVIVEDDVEIGANTTIDRPAVGETRIGAGTKIDNLVQVAHGVKLGKGVLLAAQVGIAGSTRLEDNVTLAGQVGVAGHLTIGKGVVATAQTGIPNSVDPGEYVSGYPAIGHREWLKSSAVYRQLPALRKRVADLEQRIAELEEKLAECVKPSGS
jgi:UDP-3-O-[3-hydroxymyristoyl] glucosamine N-acyltransferase